MTVAEGVPRRTVVLWMAQPISALQSTRPEQNGRGKPTALTQDSARSWEHRGVVAGEGVRAGPHQPERVWVAKSRGDNYVARSTARSAAWGNVTGTKYSSG